MPSQRLIEFDIMRGLLIILVVIGHSGVEMPWAPWVEPHWFRMPAFFMLSGYFMRELCCDAHTLRRRAVRLVLPWIAYSVLMWCLFHPEPLLKNVARTVYAGSYNITFYSFPWWFVNALMVSLIAFALLKRLNRGGVILTVILCYTLAHVQPLWRALPIPPPWGIDNAIGAIPYLYIGYRLRGHLQPRTDAPCSWHGWAIAWGIALLVCASFSILNATLSWGYKLDMKSMVYTNALLDLIVPLAFTYLTYLISLLLARISGLRAVLAYVGVACMTVFYVHAATLYIIRPLWGGVWAIVLSVLIGVGLHALWSTNRWTRTLFLGEWKKK